MLSNLYRRITIWWGEQLHRRHKRRWHKLRDPEYFTPRFKNLEGQDD